MGYVQTFTCTWAWSNIIITVSCQKCIDMYSIFSEKFVEVQWPSAIEKMVAKVVAMAKDLSK